MNEQHEPEDARDQIDAAKLTRYRPLSHLQLLGQIREIVGADELLNLLCLAQKMSGRSGQG